MSGATSYPPSVQLFRLVPALDRGVVYLLHQHRHLYTVRGGGREKEGGRKGVREGGRERERRREGGGGERDRERQRERERERKKERKRKGELIES